MDRGLILLTADHALHSGPSEDLPEFIPNGFGSSFWIPAQIWSVCMCVRACTCVRACLCVFKTKTDETTWDFRLPGNSVSPCRIWNRPNQRLITESRGLSGQSCSAIVQVLLFCFQTLLKNEAVTIGYRRVGWLGSCHIVTFHFYCSLIAFNAIYSTFRGA